MRISFEHPWLLLAVLPILVLTVLTALPVLKRKPISKKKLAALAVRCAALILIACSVAGLAAVKGSKKNAVMIVADLSDSARPNVALYEDYIKKAVSYADKNTEIGLITFGYNSEYELPLTNSPAFSSFGTSPDGNYTDIYSAVIKAAAMMPADAAKRIIILTDGKENIGRIREAATALRAQKIRLDAIVNETGAATREIQLTDIRVPDIIYSGEEFNVTVTVESASACTAVLTLKSDGKTDSRSEITLSPGTNRFVFKEKADSTGIVSYTAEISGDSDSMTKNNRIYTFINVMGTPKILVVDGTGNEAHELEKIVSDTAVLDIMPPDSVPSNIADLRKYEAVILMNTQRSQLPENWDSLIEVYVRQLGRGLLFTGGEKTYVLGDWTDTPMETVLPVDMIVKDEYQLNDVATLLLIDNSGSMTGEPLELAKEGAIKAADIVKSIDQIGVIAFSDNAVWISKLVPGTEKDTVKSKIATIKVQGGTMVYNAMEQAFAALKDSNARLKNIILLTDGYPADDYMVYNSGIIGRLKEAGVVVYCIGVGDSIDTGFLNTVAKGTEGTVSVATKASELPAIIINETLKAISRGYINNDPFLPEVKDRTALLSGVNALPRLDGYILTEAKGLAYTVLQTPDGKPVLSSWQYGLGKVVAYTSDLNGKWSSALLASEDGRKIISNMISWILPSSDTSGSGSVTIVREGDTGIITAVPPDAAESDAGYSTVATVISPSGSEEKIDLIPSGIGKYTGSFFLSEEGSYVAIVSQTDGEGNAVMNREGALAVKYSDEYDMFSKDFGYVAACCKDTGGSAAWSAIEDIFRTPPDRSESRINLAVPLLILGLVLVMADIAMRRLDLDIAGYLRRKRAAKAAAAAEAAAAAGASGAADVTADTGEGTVSRRAKRRKKASAETGVYAPPAETAPEGKAAAARPGPEKTESYSDKDARADNKKAKRDKGKAGEKPEAQPPKSAASSVNSLLKEKENMKRKKL